LADQIQPEYGLSGEDTMKLTSFRTGAASAAVLTVLTVGTAIAHADPMPAPPPPNLPSLGDEQQNYKYMYALDKEGVFLKDGNEAYVMGNQVCLALAQGRTPDDVAQQFGNRNGAAIVSLAQQIYCPAP